MGRVTASGQCIGGRIGVNGGIHGVISTCSSYCVQVSCGVAPGLYPSGAFCRARSCCAGNDWLGRIFPQAAQRAMRQELLILGLDGAPPAFFIEAMQNLMAPHRIECAAEHDAPCQDDASQAVGKIDPSHDCFCRGSTRLPRRFSAKTLSRVVHWQSSAAFGAFSNEMSRRAR